MSIEREPRINAQPYTSLDQFEQATDVVQKEQLLPEATDFALRRSFDCLTLSRLYRIGFDNILSRNSHHEKLGRKIFRDINQYFSTSPIHKILYPHKQSSSALVEVTFNLAQITKLSPEEVVSQIGQSAFAVSEQIMGLMRDLENDQRPGSRDKNRIIVLDGKLKQGNIPNRYVKGVENHGRLFNTIFKLHELDDVESLHLAETVLNEAHDEDPSSVYPFQPILRERHGGVTLGQLEHEKNIEQFSMRLLSYSAGIPRGDYFWEIITSSLQGPINLFNVNQIDPDTFFTSPDFSKKVLGFQLFLARSFFLPVFQPDMTNSRFDKVMNEILTNGSDILIEKYADILYNAFQIEREVTKKIGQYGVYSDTNPSPLHRLAMDGKRDSLLLENESLQDEIVNTFITNNLDKIHESFEKRFGNSDNLELLFDTLVQRTDEVSRIIEERKTVSEEDLQNMQQMDLTNTNALLLQVDRNAEIHPSTYIVGDERMNEFSLPDTTLANNIGIKTIRFSEGLHGGEVYFSFSEEADAPRFIGEMNVPDNTISLYPPLPDSPFSSTLKNIAWIYYDKMIAERKPEKKTITPREANQIFASLVQEGDDSGKN